VPAPEDQADLYSLDSLGQASAPDDDLDAPLVPPTVPAATSPPPPPPAPAKPKIPASLVALAKELGLDDAEIAEHDTDSLDKAVGYMMRARRLNERSLPPEQAPASREAAPPQPPPAPPKPKSLVEELGLDPDGEYDPALLAILKRQADEIAELRGVKDDVGQIRQKEQAREAQTQAQYIDSLFAKLGPEYEAAYGKGDGLSLHGKVEFDRRMAVLHALNSRQGLTPQTLPAEFERIAKAMFPAQAPAPASGSPRSPEAAPDPALEQRREQWREGALGPPASRGQKESRDAKAARAMAAAVERGGATVNGQATTDSFLD
jgi:hypothetical protein